MNTYEIAVILLLIAIFIEIILFSRVIVQIIASNSAKLDHNIAVAIQNAMKELPQKIIEDVIPNVDAPNPMQSFVMDLIQQKMNPAIQVTEISRADDGKFS